jgi:hypothetical protein
VSLPHLILMLDDDVPTTKIWSEIASHFGWRPLVANSLQEFRDHLKYASPAVTLIDLSLNETDRMNRDGLQALDAALVNGTTYCAVASNFINFEDARVILHNRGSGVCALRKQEIGTTDSLIGLLSDGYAWSLAARAPLSTGGTAGQSFRNHIVESICGSGGVGLLTQHTGLMGALILDALAAAIGDLGPFCCYTGGSRLMQEDGFVHTEVWSTTRAKSVWVGISSIPPGPNESEVPDRLVRISRAMRQHLEINQGHKPAAVAQAFRIVEQDGLVVGLIGTAEPRSRFQEFAVPYWMRRPSA